jgi:hypothetical protein
MERSKQEMKMKTEQALHMRRLEEATAQKKMEVKKKLQEVRKSLRKHLVNNRDPQVGTIMRLVDESLIYHFMEKYSGFSMSAQAILSLIGNSLGTHVADPYIPADDETPLETANATATHTRNTTAESTDPQEVRIKRNGGSERNLFQRGGSQKQLPLMTFDDSRQNTPGALTSNTSSRGRSRGLLDSEPVPASIQRSTRQCSRITNDREFQPTEQRTHPSTADGKEGTGLTDPVRGVSPRHYRADRPPSPDNKAWGGGFRIIAPRADSIGAPIRPIVPMTVSRPATLPERQRSRSESRERSRERKTLKSSGSVRASGVGAEGSLASSHKSLVVFGSDNVREVARAMGYVIDGEEITDDLASERVDDQDADAYSVFSQHSHNTRDSYHTTVPANAIAAMHEQLIEENLLPSMQPEPVLSQTQIEELGLHKKSFNQIMKELSKSNSFRSETDTEMFTDLPPLSQYSAHPSVLQSTKPSVHEIMSDSVPLSPREPVNPIVAKMMGSAMQARALFVEPLSATAAVPPAPKVYATLYGSVYTDADKERFQNMRVLEVERGEQRHGLEHPPMSAHHIELSRPYETSPDRLPQLAQLTKPPRGIKTKPSKLDEFGNPLPESPFKSHEEECKVQNTGVPAGAGYMLWRPRYRVSKDGRYRAGQSHVRLRTSLKEGPAKRPFVSAT